MRKNIIEVWAGSVLERLARSEQTEDHYVELKGEWIDPQQAARRLAGHANSAPNEHILWLIGVDEQTGKPRGVPQQELTEWWPKVEAEFADFIAPEMTAVAMQREGMPIVAIAFSTDRAPYVVRNPNFGTKGHNIKWEVPMRVGTGVRTATRNQLLSLLAPTLHLPRYELVAASAILHKPERKEYTDKRIEGWAQKCIVHVNFYLIAQGNETITLDPGACEVMVEIPRFTAPAPLGVPTITPTGAPNVSTSGNICRFTDTVRLLLNAEGDIPSIGNQYAEELRIEVKIRPIGHERATVVSSTLTLQEGVSTATGITHSFVLKKLPVGETQKSPHLV
jgi:hypothetical protein